jgi:pimeloyl-ACP methyl ester carboxylesterase
MIAELDEVSLCYETAGGGAPVLLITGTGSDLRHPPGPFAWPGAEAFSLLAYDHRDLGRSVSRADGQPTMEGDARLAGAIERYLAVDGGFASGEPAPAGLLRQLGARRGHDTCERLARIRARTLVAAGRFDGVAPPARSERIAAAIPDGRPAVFDGGHGFLTQDASAWPGIAELLGDGA